MRPYASIAVIEFAGIADGIYCTDAILKRAPIAMIKSGTISHGKYLVIIGGSTASVEESLNEALVLGNNSIIDHAFLPDVHANVHDAVLGQRAPIVQDAVAILETATVATNVRAAELAVKGTEVRLVELRLAEYELSGKAISLYNGELYEVQAAMDIAADLLRGKKEYIQHRIIAQPHEILTQKLGAGTQFAAARPHALEGEEVS
jgi:microcompartment protein CcmL/EutN